MILIKATNWKMYFSFFFLHFALLSISFNMTCGFYRGDIACRLIGELRNKNKRKTKKKDKRSRATCIYHQTQISVLAHNLNTLNTLHMQQVTLSKILWAKHLQYCIYTVLHLSPSTPLPPYFYFIPVVVKSLPSFFLPFSSFFPSSFVLHISLDFLLLGPPLLHEEPGCVCVCACGECVWWWRGRVGGSAVLVR